MIRTKILATMGPACSDVETLHRLFDAGANACRLNFSHGSLDDHLKTLQNIREASRKWGQPIAVLGDLCGPKIRLGKINDRDGTGGLAIGVGDELAIQREPIVGDKSGELRRVSCTYPAIVDDVRVGDRVYVEDGLVRFICTDKSNADLRCRCTSGGILKTAKGINLPNSPINLPCLTERDWQCVQWAIENQLDYLALSFVRKADDIALLREHLRNHVSDIHLIAKIEKAEALADIDDIISAADALMIARGDLGVELDLARVPVIQKDLIARCQLAAKPVIVATQMLQSMIEQSSPTRAEVSDVANAIIDGADAVMLSGETSVGKYPVASVHVMSHVAEVTEAYLDEHPIRISVDRAPSDAKKLRTLQLSAAAARGVRQIVADLSVKLVIVYSPSGATARIFSKERFPVPIVALSSDQMALRRMALHYGVIPQDMPPPDDLKQLVVRCDAMVQERKFAAPGDRVIVVAGSPLGADNTMSAIVMHTIGELVR